MFTYCGVIAFFTVLSYFFVTPLLVYFNYRIQAHPKVEVYDPAAGMPEPVRENFDRGFHEFTALQFRHLGTFTLPNAVKNYKTLFAVYENEEHRVIAGTNASFVKVQNQWKLHGQIIAMSTEFDDESGIETTNQTDLFIFPVPAGNVRTQHPELQSVSDLFRAHRSIVDQRDNGREKVAELHSKFDGDVQRYFNENLFREFSRAAEAGRLRLKESTHANNESVDQQQDLNPFKSPTANPTDESSVFVLTLVGAYIANWSSLWPIKPILARIRFARDRKLLAKTGFRWP